MAYYISHQSALECYQSPKALRRIRPEIETMGYFSPAEQQDGLSASGVEAIADSLGLSLPLHVLVGHSDERRASKCLECHVWPYAMHHESFARLSSNVYVSSPCFTLQQLAAQHSSIENIYLASVLGSRFNKDLSSRTELFHREELLRFLNESHAPLGREKAKKAAGHVLFGARSPKELQIGLLLSLPRRMGGRGIRDLQLNKSIKLTEELKTLANRQYLECDGYSELVSCVFEYDSDQHHLSPLAHERDSRKANVLRLMGIDLFTITKGQLYDWSAFDAIAEVLERRVCPRKRNTDYRIKERQHDLWSQLVYGDLEASISGLS